MSAKKARRFNLFKLRCVLFLIAAACVSFSAAFAATTYDDFKTRWKTLRFGSGATQTMVRERLEVSLAANARNAGRDFFAAGLSSTCTVSGDFDLRVSYRLLDWSTGNGVRTALYLGTPADVVVDKGVFVERDSYSLADGGPREVYVFFGGEDILQEVDTTHTGGQLRLARVGSRVTGYYGQGTQWVALSSINVGTKALPFAILAYSHNSVFADTFVRVAFDDVVLVAGSFAGTTCPFSSL